MEVETHLTFPVENGWTMIGNPNKTSLAGREGGGGGGGAGRERGERGGTGEFDKAAPA